MAAWVSKEWMNKDGKRRREKVPPKAKMTSIKGTDIFVVEWLEPGTSKRRRKKIPGTGRPAKKKADDTAKSIDAKITLWCQSCTLLF